MLTILTSITAFASLAVLALLLGMRGKLGKGGSAVTAAELHSLKEKVGGQEGLMRDEFARNRKEASELAQAQREELRNSLTAFEKRLDENAKAQQDALRQQFDDLLTRSEVQVDVDRNIAGDQVVRAAFVASVTCAAPPVRCQIK